jgi:glycerol uptake operon antiterminator
LNFLQVLQERPIIAAFRDIEKIPFKEIPLVDVLFLLGGTIFDLPAIVARARKFEKLVFVDIDLIKGVGKDASGISYLARESKVNGIITTKGNLIASAQRESLSSIQRVFVLDSESLTGGLQVINKSAPDAIEVLPGLVLPKIMQKIRAKTAIPIIAGGLITKPEEIEEILAAGAVGISTSSPHLFKSADQNRRKPLFPPV